MLLLIRTPDVTNPLRVRIALFDDVERVYALEVCKTSRRGYALEVCETSRRVYALEVSKTSRRVYALEVSKTRRRGSRRDAERFLGVADNGSVVEDRIEVQTLAGEILCEQLAQRTALIDRPLGQAMHHPVGVIAARAALNQRQEHALGEQGAMRSASGFLAHPLGVYDHAANESEHPSLHVILQDRRVRKDDPLERRNGRCRARARAPRSRRRALVLRKWVPPKSEMETTDAKPYDCHNNPQPCSREEIRQSALSEVDDRQDDPDRRATDRNDASPAHFRRGHDQVGNCPVCGIKPLYVPGLIPWIGRATGG